MGLFDAFKKKVEVKSEEVNPLYNMVNGAGLPINNLQVSESNGTVTVTGSTEDGAAIDGVNEIIKAAGKSSIQNNIEVLDISHLGLMSIVTTKGSNLNCRKGPSTDDEIVGKFANGSQVQILKKLNSNWHLVKANEIQGFCSTEFLK